MACSGPDWSSQFRSVSHAFLPRKGSHRRGKGGLPVRHEVVGPMTKDQIMDQLQNCGDSIARQCFVGISLRRMNYGLDIYFFFLFFKILYLKNN